MYCLFFFFSVFESCSCSLSAFACAVAFEVLVSGCLWGFGEAKKCMALLFYTHGDFCRLFVIIRLEDQNESTDESESQGTTFSFHFPRFKTFLDGVGAFPRPAKGHRRGSSVYRHVFTRACSVYLRQHAPHNTAEWVG
jgi:hypothetical protein